MPDQPPARNYPLEKLYEVAVLRYINDKSLDEIAKTTGFSRSTVARMLKSSSLKSMVQIHVTPPEHGHLRQLEQDLVGSYKLKQAIVVQGSENLFEGRTAHRDGVALKLAQAAGDYISGQFRLNMQATVVVSPGQQVRSAIEFIKTDIPLASLKIVPMTGFASRRYHPTSAPANGIELARVTRSENYYWLPCPAFVNKEQEELVKLLPVIKATLDVMESATLVITGIGAFNQSKQRGMVRSEFINAHQLQKFLSGRDKLAMGDIGGQLFGVDGGKIDTPWCTIGYKIASSFSSSASLQHLVSSERGEVIAIAGLDRERLEPIRGALRGKYISTLITDSTTAQWLVDNLEL